MKVALFFNNHMDNTGSRYHAPLWDQAVTNLGWESVSKIDDCDVAVMWGPQPEYFICKDMGRPALIVDFGYWNRAWKEKTEHDYYKISLNGQHQTPYLMKENHPDDRYRKSSGPAIKPWKRAGDYILLCGIGHKAAVQYGYQKQWWERTAIEKLRQYTDMKILYRRKPNNRDYGPIPDYKNVEFDEGKYPISHMLDRAYAAITHHGNCGIDALAEGVPVFMNGNIGVASSLANLDLAKIIAPYYPENRQQFFNNLSYWQWSVPEIRAGLPLLSMRERGLI